MSAAASVESMLSVGVIRGMLRDSTEVIRTKKEGKNLSVWDAPKLARFAAWAAAIEGAIELIPEVVELLVLWSNGAPGDTHADFQGPIDALEEVLNKADERKQRFDLAHHRSSRVRRQLAGMQTYQAEVMSDWDPTVRMLARKMSPVKSAPPWWKGVTATRPPQATNATEFGDLAKTMAVTYEWGEPEKLAEAFLALPREFAASIAPMFLPSLWCRTPWLDAVWEVLLKSDDPLRERVARAEQAVGRLVTATTHVHVGHGPSLQRALALCSEGERAAFASMAATVLANLEPCDQSERSAGWTPSQRRARKRPPRVAPIPPNLFKRLVQELAHPSAWGASRWNQHPRARFELGRALGVLAESVKLRSGDALTVTSNLAQLVAESGDRRPDGREAVATALAGLLRRLHRDDPIISSLARHRVPHVREAVALSEIGDEAKHAWSMLDAPNPTVWMAARCAVSGAERWRGLFTEDPFKISSSHEADELARAIVALDEAVPRARFSTLTDDDFTRMGRAAISLPAPPVWDFVLRVIPTEYLNQHMALLAAAVLRREGGWDVWAAETERRVSESLPIGTWFGSSHITNALAQSAEPKDGGPPVLWPVEVRRAAARNALQRYDREPSKADESVTMWLDAAISLWPDEDDPFPLPGPWTSDVGVLSYRLAARFTRTGFRREWKATQAIMSAARNGFESWSYAYRSDDIFDQLPDDLKLELALEGFWRDEHSLGSWSRTYLQNAISRARQINGNALVVLLSDPRLAPENLLQAHRHARVLFLLRARVQAGVADLAETFLTLSLVRLNSEADRWTEDELAAFRLRWNGAIQSAMEQGPGGLRGSLITMAPPGLWEPIDRSFVHAVASDATSEEAQAIARRLGSSGNANDVDLARELSERFPSAADWTAVISRLSVRPGT